MLDEESDVKEQSGLTRNGSVMKKEILKIRKWKEYLKKCVTEELKDIFDM